MQWIVFKIPLRAGSRKEILLRAEIKRKLKACKYLPSIQLTIYVGALSSQSS